MFCWKKLFIVNTGLDISQRVKSVTDVILQEYDCSLLAVNDGYAQIVLRKTNWLKMEFILLSITKNKVPLRVRNGRSKLETR